MKVRDSSKISAIKSDDGATVVFRSSEKFYVFYVEDSDIGYYQSIIEQIVPDCKKEIRVLTPQVDFDNIPYLDTPNEYKLTKSIKAKSGVLKRHDEAIWYKSKNVFCIVDADYDRVLHTMLDKYKNSKLLHILNVYSIENYHINIESVRKQFKSRIGKYERKNHIDIDSFHLYRKWEQNIVDAYKVILPYQLASHIIISNDKHKYNGIRTANIEVDKFFNYKNENVSVNLDQVYKEYGPIFDVKYKDIRKAKIGLPAMKRNKEILTTQKTLVDNMSNDEVMATIHGKTLLELFLNYLFDVSTCIKGQSECDMDCRNCKNVCLKINYKGKATNFRVTNYLDVFEHSRFSSLIDFIQKSAI